jgi:hypothetical protein
MRAFRALEILMGVAFVCCIWLAGFIVISLRRMAQSQQGFFRRDGDAQGLREKRGLNIFGCVRLWSKPK